MEHIGGSKTQECKACGSRLIEEKQCLTCDSKDLKQIEVGLFINYDEPGDLDIKLEYVMPVLDGLYKQEELEDGDTIHVVPVADLEKIYTLVDGYNATYDAFLDVELIKL